MIRKPIPGDLYRYNDGGKATIDLYLGVDPDNDVNMIIVEIEPKSGALKFDKSWRAHAAERWLFKDHWKLIAEGKNP